MRTLELGEELHFLRGTNTPPTHDDSNFFFFFFFFPGLFDFEVSPAGPTLLLVGGALRFLVKLIPLSTERLGCYN